MSSRRREIAAKRAKLGFNDKSDEADDEVIEKIELTKWRTAVSMPDPFIGKQYAVMRAHNDKAKSKDKE